MSRIIRSMNVQPSEDHKEVPIALKKIFPISSEQTATMEEDSQTLSMQDIFQERDRYMAEAKREIHEQRQQFEQFRKEQLEAIDELKRIWEEEKKELKYQAHEEGFAGGYEEGTKKAESEMLQSLHIANETMHTAKQNAQKYLEEQEHVILHLALSVAERIIGVALNNDNELFSEIVKRGLKEAREMKEIKVYLSSKYYPIVLKSYDELKEMFPPNVPLLFFVNEDMANEESYIETNHGRIVLTIDDQLSELRKQLIEILENKE